jgi:dsRNA-specific ribonuclease
MTSCIEAKNEIVAEEDSIFNPYNPNNVEISQQEIVTILKKYGLPPRITNFELWRRAFIHRSYTKRPAAENEANDIILAPKPPNCLPLSTKSNERLEFLGDGVLECITKYYLYRRFPKENEGFMTEKKIALVKNESIGKLAYEMGLNKWYIISNHAEEKKTRTNLKKLGCLFEAFLGALFLDFNKIEVRDEENWFKNVFVTGPGWQMAQKFVENVFETHVDWIELINNDDNYKNIIQVKIQKEFKTTPHYVEIGHDLDLGYHMGVYLCLGQQIYEVDKDDAIHYNKFNSFESIQDYLEENEKVFIFLGEGQHKIKKKAEQIACNEALQLLK